jgi:transcriptional regulator with XRE-family HTH domain
MARQTRPHQKPPRFRRTYIAKWREVRNLTQEQLAARLDMTQSHLSMLENGKRGYTQETLEAIAHALQTDVASLLMRDPTTPEALWSIWEQAQQGQRDEIERYAEFIVRRRTGT